MNKIIKIILLLTLTFSTSVEKVIANEKIKIGLLVPLTGKNSEIGQSIIKSTPYNISIKSPCPPAYKVFIPKFSKTFLTSSSACSPF